MRMKKFYFIILILCLSLVGCSGKESKETVQTVEKPANTPKKEKKKEEAKKEETTPSPSPTPSVVTDDAAIIGMAEDIMENMTLDEKIGQMFMVNLELLDNSKGKYYEHQKFTEKMKKNLEKYPVGGVTFFARNLETRQQTTELIEKLQENSKIPLFISVDEEGGDVARVANNDNMRTTKFPSMEEVGEMNNEQYAYNMGSVIASEIKELGFNVDFAPVADVKTNILNTEIGNRSFGDDADLVSRMATKVAEGIQDQGVSATLKHFPGHGDVSEDSHEGSVNVDNDLNRLRKVEFKPFEAGIEAGVDMIMVSHISISRVTESTEPASVSSLVMKEMLRTEMGFEGIILTDAMNMKAITDLYDAGEAAVKSIKAGVDIVVMPDELGKAFKAVKKAVEDGKISEKTIDDSVERIIQLKIRRGLILSDTELILPQAEE